MLKNIIFFITLSVPLYAHAQETLSAEQLYHKLLTLREAQIEELTKKLDRLEREVEELKSGKKTPQITQETPLAPQQIQFVSREPITQTLPYIPAEGSPTTPLETAPIEPFSPWEFQAGALYLKPSTGDMLAGSLFHQDGSNETLISQGKVKYGYEPGITASIYHHSPQGWSQGLHYAQIMTHARHDLNTANLIDPANFEIRATPSFGINPTTNFTSVASTAHFTHRTGGISFAKDVPMNPFVLNLFGTIRLAQFDWDQKNAYANGANSLDTDLTQKFFGAGPELGLRAKYNVGTELQMFAQTSAAAYFGRHHSKIHVKSQGASNLDQTSVNPKDLRTVPQVGFEVGLNWRKKIKNNAGIGVELAFIAQNWFQLNRQPTSTGASNFTGFDGSTRHDIMLNGLKVHFISFW